VWTPGATSSFFIGPGANGPDSGDLDLRAIPRATVLVFDGSTGALVSVESEARAGQTGRRGCATR